MEPYDAGYAELKKKLDACGETPFANCAARKLDAYKVADGYILATWTEGDAQDLEFVEKLPGGFTRL